MTWRRKLARSLGVAFGVLVLAAVVLAPSWRNYYLRRSTVRIVEDQSYLPDDDNPKHQLDLYLPTAGARPWPVVVFVHGGFWRPFNRRMLQPFTGLHGCVGVALANSGVATAVVGYRQRPEAASIGDALDDVARAVRYVVDNIGQQGGIRRAFTSSAIRPGDLSRRSSRWSPSIWRGPAFRREASAGSPRWPAPTTWRA